MGRDQVVTRGVVQIAPEDYIVAMTDFTILGSHVIALAITSDCSVLSTHAHRMQLNIRPENILLCCAFGNPNSHSPGCDHFQIGKSLSVSPGDTLKQIRQATSEEKI